MRLIIVLDIYELKPSMQKVFIQSKIHLHLPITGFLREESIADVDTLLIRG